MTSSAGDPRRGPMREALGELPRHGARVWWIREDGAELLRLQCVQDAAEKLKAEKPELLETPDSDGRAEALIQILRECLDLHRNITHSRLLRPILDLDGEALDSTATERRTTAGQEFRGRSGRTVGPSGVRQTHEPRALDWLTDVLLAYEDAHVARHDD